MELGSFLFYAYLACMGILFVFSWHNFVMIYYFLKHRNDPERARLDFTNGEFPRVTIQLPIYNEHVVAERLIDSACRIDWPKDKLEIQVLDDSTDHTTQITKATVEKWRALGFCINRIHRTDRKGYKAGALREALEKATGEFIAIFDADFIPEEDFLHRAIPHFSQNEIGMVQTRWGYLNEDYSLLTKTQAIGLNGHFVIQQLARSRAGFFINFNGTGGIWRQSCIRDAGNWHDDTLTEDLDLSYRAQLKGWKFVYLNDVVSPGELPIGIHALKTQQFRWTKGSVETAKKIIPKIIRSELPMWTKIQSLFHLTANFSYIFVLVSCLLNSSILFLTNDGRFNAILDIMTVFVLSIVGLFVFYFYSERTINPNWKKKMILLPVFMMGSVGLSVSNAKAVWEGIFNIKSSFIRTPKWGLLTAKKPTRFHGVSMDGLFWAELVIVVFMTIALIAGIRNYYLEKANFIGMIFFNIWILTGFLMVLFLSVKHVYQNRAEA